MFSFFVFASRKSQHMHRIRENFKHNKLYLAGAAACSRSGLLMMCFENWLPLGKKPWASPSTSVPGCCRWQRSDLGLDSFPTSPWERRQLLALQPCVPGSFSPFLAVLFSHIKGISSPASCAGLQTALLQRLEHARSPSASIHLSVPSARREVGLK